MTTVWISGKTWTEMQMENQIDDCIKRHIVSEKREPSPAMFEEWRKRSRKYQNQKRHPK